MTKTIWVPLHLDALVLDAPEPVVGAGLDLTTAPWFGDNGEKVSRDHFSNFANVAAALRTDPMSPDNRMLQPGTHLHWALPDALTHGTTAAPGGKSHVARDGLWFPKVPNRWVVLRRSGAGFATLDDAWLVESDFVHPEREAAPHLGGMWDEDDLRRFEDLTATLYPIPPGSTRQQPYVRLGRSYSLMHGTRPTQTSDGALADYDAPLTAVGHGDPGFAALYTACHSVFGLHDIRPLTGDMRYDLIGWYSDPADTPLSHWRALFAGGTPEQLYDAFRDLTGWVLSDVDRRKAGTPVPQDAALFDPGAQLMFAASVTVPAAIPAGAKPDAVKGTVAVGLSTNEAIATLLSEGDPDVENLMEAIAFHTELADHQLDYGPKLREARHAAGFTTTGKTSVWSLRPAEDALSHPITGAQPQTEKAHDALPDWIAQELNRLNVAQEALDHALHEAESLRAQLYADWQLYMRATYPEDDRADFALDADVLRDTVLSQSMTRLDAAVRGLDPAVDGSAAAWRDLELARMRALLADLGQTAPALETLELIKQAGPRFVVPNDPVIATRGAAMAQNRRHGKDGRARADDKLECLAGPAVQAPGATIDVTAAEALAGALAALRTPGDAFGAIADHTPSTKRPWNAILLEWQATVEAYNKDTNLRATEGRYARDAVTRNFDLADEACELSFQAQPAARDLHSASAISGRTILNARGAEVLQDAFTPYETATLKRNQTLNAEETAAKKALDFQPGDPPVVSTALGGFNERLLMRVVEEQLPIADPLGFPEDQARAAAVRAHVGNPNGLWSADTEAPFLPLRTARLALQSGRIIDSFGQHVPWMPGGDTHSDILTAASLRHGSMSEPYLPPRSTQPARLDFRWLSTQDDLMQTNDHPASSPLCGWLVPNPLDNDVLVYDGAGTLLGIIDLAGIWRPAPGDPTAPDGPGLIENAHLARVAQWITRNGSESFIEAFLNTLDSAFNAIDPADYAVQNAAALLLGRPVAVARAMIDMTLQGLPAQDQSQKTLAGRIHGDVTLDQGFGEIQFPLRLGEHGQMNDGLIGYFRSDENLHDGHETLHVPQSDPSTQPQIRNSQPGDLTHGFQDEAKLLTLLLDPRAPVHVTSGLLPTKAIRIPQHQFMPSMRALEMMFAATPIVTAPDALKIPLPRISGRTWAWVALEEGRWTTQPGRATVTLDDLRKALPGRIEITSATVMRLLAPGEIATPGARVETAADMLWMQLLAQNWITEIEAGRAWLKGPPAPDSPALSLVFGKAATQTLLSKIATGIQPTDHTAHFGKRPVVREGWLKLTPNREDAE